MLSRMILALFLAASFGGPALAQAQKPPSRAPAPKPMGKFGDWTAVKHQEGGATVCYAYSLAQSSTPTLPGRGAVVLTVTQRPSGRDAVAFDAGFAYPHKATISVQVDQTGLDFYTAKSSAFAYDGKAAVAAFQRGRQAVVRSTGPKDTPVTDSFSLTGFTDAYRATLKECPPR